MAKNKNIDSYFSSDFMIFFGIFAGIITLVLGIKIFQFEYQFIFSFTFLPIFCGLFFEQKRLGYSWKEILIKSFASYCIISLCLLIGLQNEEYHSQIDTSFLFFIFIISFIIISISYAYYLKTNYQLTAKLTEGILLLQSISILYLIFAQGFWENINFITVLATITVFLPCGYAFFHAFISKVHNEKSKLYLSVWSSIMTLIFSIFYFSKMFKVEITGLMSLKEYILGIIQFFLFGISIIYAAQNFWLVIRFMPEKGESSESYASRLKALKKEHIERFSDQQIPISSSLFCLIFVGGIYFLNFKFNWIPSYTMIWIVFTFFPFIIYFWEYFFLKTEKKIN